MHPHVSNVLKLVAEIALHLRLVLNETLRVELLPCVPCPAASRQWYCQERLWGHLHSLRSQPSSYKNSPLSGWSVLAGSGEVGKPHRYICSKQRMQTFGENPVEYQWSKPSSWSCSHGLLDISQYILLSTHHPDVLLFHDFDACIHIDNTLVTLLPPYHE